MSYREYELPAIGDCRKSFYGKARIQERQDGNVKTLLSYNTAVASRENGRFIRLWGGYSGTTMRHINSFRAYCGLPALSKKEWEQLPTE